MMLVSLHVLAIAKPLYSLIAESEIVSGVTPSDNNQMLQENQSVLLLESGDVLMSEY